MLLTRVNATVVRVYMWRIMRPVFRLLHPQVLHCKTNIHSNCNLNCASIFSPIFHVRIIQLKLLESDMWGGYIMEFAGSKNPIPSQNKACQTMVVLFLYRTVQWFCVRTILFSKVTRGNLILFTGFQLSLVIGKPLS